MAAGSFLISNGKSWLLLFFLILIGVLSLQFKLSVLPSLDSEAFLTKLLEVSLLPYFYQFLLGFACLPLLATLGRRNSVFCLILFGICCAFGSRFWPSFDSLFTPLALSMLSIGLGMVPVNFLCGLDIFYGIYIYHMLVVNILIASGAAVNYSESILISIYFCTTLLFAVFSWFLIEKPSLSLKSKISFGLNLNP